ncbi:MULTISPECIES: hypothetical protein [Nocardia]|uniref:hypothetical protein n=1 Tax=Nocardia TaxID=1817 RepID=UPI000D69808B|nr:MULTISPECIES: hypothetical protein [Nocardia]
MNTADLIAKYENEDQESLSPEADAIYELIHKAWRSEDNRWQYGDYDDHIEGLKRLGAYIAVELGARA